MLRPVPAAYARRNDPVTSWQAAASLSDDAVSGSQQWVLGTLREGGPATVEQLCRGIPREGGFPKWTEQRIRSACSELEKCGLTFRYSEDGVSRRGRKCTVWAASDHQEKLTERRCA
ncbi:hypothetical protein ACU19_04800 [Actinobaculum suis]|nr:hypothetical protein ACU19_04800 [Actinobaculum suis]